MARFRARDAKQMMVDELAREGLETVSAFTVADGARPGTADLSWWHEHTPANEKSDTRRSIAYLRGYMRIGGRRLYAGGIFLDRRRLWLDRSVISRLVRDGYLSFEGQGSQEPWFELTAKGSALLNG